MTIKESCNICNKLKTLDKLGYPVRPKNKVTVRTSKPLTSKELQELDEKIGYSETLESAQTSLIWTKFKSAHR